MTDTKTCSSCGAAVPAAAAFCTSCGQRMAADEGTPPPPPSPWAPPGSDATRVDAAGLHDATQVRPPMDPPPIDAPAVSLPPAPDPMVPTGTTPWASGPSTEVPAGPPGTAPWNPPASPPPPTWQHPAPPPSSATFGAAPDPATSWAPPGVAAPPGAWGAPVAAPAAPANRPSVLGGVAALAGAVLTVIGVFSGWVTLDPGTSSETDTLWSLASGDGLLKTNDAYLIAGLALVAAVLGLLLFTGVARTLVRIAVIGVGIAILAAVALDWMNIANYVTDNLPTTFSATTAIGFYLAIGGGVLTVAAGLMPAKK